jgi:hypothetical protein
MKAARGQLVLAMSDRALCSLLAARLGMAGETPITTASHLNPVFGTDFRAAALLIVEDRLIAQDPPEWSGTLRNQGWTDQIIVIVDMVPDPPPVDAMMISVERRDAGATVPTLVQLWQSKFGKHIKQAK